jgi:alcohol dehydrogenase (cytochrome c)
MGMKRVALMLAAAALVPVLGSIAQAAELGPYTPVTDARLESPEARNWLMYRGNYEGWGYSPLKSISDKNVGKLQLAWSYTTGELEGHQAPPIVNNGYMYVTTPNNQIIALEAATGRELWRYKKQIPAEMMQLHPTNRGVGLYEDKVYIATTDAMLIALDAVTGKVLWESQIANWKEGYYSTLAPLVAKGKVMVGVSGGEFGVRGQISGFDAKTGKKLWTTYTIPDPTQPGGDTWPAGAYKTGGGSVWITGTYDKSTGLSFWGTGNAAPWMADTRPGDNLYSSSLLAIDVDTGAIKGHHQYHYNDSWDWDEVSAPILIDVKRDGVTRKSLVHAGRDGYLWVMERTDGEVNFTDGWPYVTQDVFKGIDPKTGRPVYDPTKIPGTGKTTHFCPSMWGGKDWFPEAYSPDTGLFYVPANNNLCSELTGEPTGKYKAGELYIGVALSNILTNVRMTEASKKHVGEIQAWNLDKKKQAWTATYPEMNWGPLMTTGGNLLFGGGTNDRLFHAYNATSGKLLWTFPMTSGVNGVPSSFEIDGEQYIAVQSGWGVDAQRMQGAFDAVLDHKTHVPQGGAIWVFKLPKS